MQLRVVAVGAVLALVAGGCGVHMSVHQAFEPAPSLDCVASALAEAPDVTDVTPIRRSRVPGYEGFEVTLHDSAAGRSVRSTLLRATAPDSVAVVSVIFGFGNARPRAATERRDAALGAMVLDLLRVACAPTSRRTVECVYSAGGRERSCRSESPAAQ
jgi:hypothetical protein